MSDTPAARIVQAWIKLEKALRGVLPVCSVTPPNQPSELLTALRVSGALGPDDEVRIAELRATRGRVAFGAEDPSDTQAARYQEAVRELVERLRTRRLAQLRSLFSGIASP